jgi:ATP-dependent RNA helicase DDX23/PRP28
MDFNVNGHLSYRQRLVEVLNTGGFSAPIIVFVNQKKTADMVAKDLQRAHVRFKGLIRLFTDGNP